MLAGSFKGSTSTIGAGAGTGAGASSTIGAVAGAGATASGSFVFSLAQATSKLANTILIKIFFMNISPFRG
jgi:hypothetical protein